MAFSKEQERDYGTIFVLSVPTTPTLSEILTNKCRSSRLNSSPLFRQCASFLQFMSLVPMSPIIEALSLVPLWTSGRHLVVSRTDEALPILKNELVPSFMVNCDIAVFLAWFILYGSMIEPVNVVSTQRYALTIIPALGPLMVAKVVPSVALFASFFTTPHRERMWMKLGPLNERNMSFLRELSISVLWDAFGRLHTQCLTTTSTRKSFPIVVWAESPLQLCDKLQQDKVNDNTENTPTLAYEVNQITVPSDNEKGSTMVDDTQEPMETADEAYKSEEKEDEWEVVNETLIYADCGGAVEPELIAPGKTVLFLDLDTENPLIQIGPAIFQGTYAQCLGTNLLFERHDPAPNVVQESTSTGTRPSIDIFASRIKSTNRPYFTYAGKTSKNLNLQRVFLKPKE